MIVMESVKALQMLNALGTVLGNGRSLKSYLERGEGWTRKVLEPEIGMVPECYALLTDISLDEELFLIVNSDKQKRLQQRLQPDECYLRSHVICDHLFAITYLQSQ
jgi:hypothetical protein